MLLALALSASTAYAEVLYHAIPAPCDTATDDAIGLSWQTIPSGTGVRWSGTSSCATGPEGIASSSTLPERPSWHALASCSCRYPMRSGVKEQCESLLIASTPNKGTHETLMPHACR